MTTEWRPVVGHESSYEVSDDGQVRSLPRSVTDSLGRTFRNHGRVMRPILSGNRDYLTVILRKDGKSVNRYIHRLVLEAFVGPCPSGMECCHANSNGFDNRVANLRWDTRSANVCDTVRAGHHPHGSKTHCKRGHEFSEDNTYAWTNPRTGQVARICRTCQRLRSSLAAASH